MKKRMKKVLALGLSVAMICGLSSTAMAAEETAPEQTVEVEADADTQAAPEADSTAEQAEADAGSTEAEADSATEQETVPGADTAEEAASEQAAPETEAGTVEAGEDASVVNTAPNLLNGLVQMNEDKGNWYNFRNGVVDIYTYETLAPYGGSWWYVRHGQVDFEYEGLCEYNGTQWYIKGGQVQFGFSGFVQLKDESDDDYEWYYIHNGQIDHNYSDVVWASKDGVEGWYCIENGDLEIYTVAANSNGWWYIGEDGMVDWSYTGVGYNMNGGWFIRKGQVDFNYNGPWEENYTSGTGYTRTYQYWFKNGKVDESITGVFLTEVNGHYDWHGYECGELVGYANSGIVLPNENGWWFIDANGEVAWDYTGIGHNENGMWYVKNGQVDFSYNGLYDSGDKKYPEIAKVVNGKVDDSFTGVFWMEIRGKWDNYGFDHGELSAGDVLQNYLGWWYVGEDGTVDFSYNGTGSNENGTWKIVNGTVDFGFNGTVKASDDYYQYFQNGRFACEMEDVVPTTVDGEDGWWHVSDGWIDKTDATVAYNSNGWWSISEGKVEFDYTGAAFNENGIWYVRNGKVDFGANGLCETDYGIYHYVQNGYIDSYYCNVVLDTINNEEAWYVVQAGMYEPGEAGIECNENGTWFYEDSKVDFSANGEYQIDVNIPSYEDDFVVEFTYVIQVAGGRVTDVRVISTNTEE